MITPQARELELDNIESLVAEARRVLREEAAAILSSAERLSGVSLSSAVELIVSCRGRVVVSGMGKSGAIGRKLAGTLSSTGTAAFFLHPAEMVHGDLGAVSSDDVVIALSYSGETDELTKLLPAFSRLGLPVIALTSRRDSTLGNAANVVIDISVDREACPMNLAPTTSTTVMLGMSDALALVVMQTKKFSRNDYALLHPAGTLGRKLLLRVQDIMRTGGELAVVDEETPLLDVMLAVHKAHSGAAVVVDRDGQLSGLITDGDFRRQFVKDRDSFDAPVRLAMNSKPGVVPPDILAIKGLEMLESFHPDGISTVGEAPVVDPATGKPVGMLTLKDLVRAGIATTI